MTAFPRCLMSGAVRRPEKRIFVWRDFQMITICKLYESTTNKQTSTCELTVPGCEAERNAGRWCGRDQVTIDVHSKKRPKRGNETSRLLTRCANSTPPRPLVMTSKRGYEAVRQLKVTYSNWACVLFCRSL